MESNEFESRLRSYEHTAIALFAVRCALRSLPLVTNISSLKHLFVDLDNQKSSSNLLSLFSALQMSLSFCAYNKNIDASIADKIDAITISEKKSVTSQAVKSIAFAAYSANLAYLFSLEKIESPTDLITQTRAISKIIARASTTAKIVELQYLIEEARSDLDRLDKGEDLLTLPLWPNSAPEKWKRVFEEFTTLIKNLNLGFEIWIDWYNDRIVGQPLNKELEEIWFDIPPEILARGADATNAYISSLRLKLPQEPLNIVRSIFIGNGAAGKTSLIRALHGEPVREGQEEMTPGIEIRKWPVEGTNINAHFWDFGGQVMSHSTHQFFLRERCLYILVLESRAEFNANDQAEYWLEHIKAFGKSAPVMLVGNKADLTSVNLDMHHLKEKYQNIIGFYPISCSQVANGRYELYFDMFKKDFIEQLQALGTHQIYFTKEQFSVLKEVRKRSTKSAFLSFTEFDELCSKYDVGKVGLKESDFLGLLDSLGEVIYFPNLTRLNSFVLNPRWLTYGVYTLLYSEEINKNQGRLSESEVISILQSKEVKDENGNSLNYPKDKCSFIIDAMEEFKLCYKLHDGSKNYVIPDKLPAEQPELINDFDKNKANTLKFEYEFRSFLPRHIMPNLIVSRHEDIHRNKSGSQLVWQNGVILYNKNQKALARIQVDYHHRVVKLWVQGRGSREYSEVLNDELHKILNRMEKLESEEILVLPNTARTHNISNIDSSDKTTTKRFLEEVKQGKELFISDAGHQYYTEQILNTFMSKNQQREKNLSINITQNFYQNESGTQTFGNHNSISQTINFTENDQKQIEEFKESIQQMMIEIESFDVEFKTKYSAYQDLQEINDHLIDIDNSSIESNNKLLQLLKHIKDGSSEAISLAKKMSDSEKTISWIISKAETVATILQNIGN